MTMSQSTRLVVWVGLFGVTYAVSCSSRFYCKTDEIKYISMSEKKQSYLNTTEVSKHTVENITECQRLCNREPRCFSININITNEKQYECQILEENMFSNATMMVLDANFIHLFLESPCSKKPCKNSGTCIPLYVNDSYVCNCINNITFKAVGENCEKRFTYFETADYYWTFDSFPNIAKTGTNMIVSNANFISNIKTMHEPGRRDPVAYCYGSSYCTRILTDIPCVTSFSACLNGFTYSLWIKLRSTVCDVLFNHLAGTSTGVDLSYSAGAFSFKVYPNQYKAWRMIKFGMNINVEKWTHLVLTFNTNTGICAYINGNLERCENTNSAVSVTVRVKQFRVGYRWDGSTRCNLYADDFAVWKSALKAEDARKIYLESEM